MRILGPGGNDETCACAWQPYKLAGQRHGLLGKEYNKKSRMCVNSCGQLARYIREGGL